MRFTINWKTWGQVIVNIEAVKNKKKNGAHICTTYSTYQLISFYEIFLNRICWWIYVDFLEYLQLGTVQYK